MGAITVDYWRDICVEAFKGDSKSNDFILFIEACKTKPPTNGCYTFQTTNFEFQQHLKQLEFQPLDDNTWTISNENLTLLAETKRQARSAWHLQRQEELKQHLTKTLSNITKPLDITNQQRLSLIQEFVKVHQNDLGSVPFFRGLVGCLKYQLQNKYQVVEWKLSEYVLTQNNEEPMEAYIRLLRGVLGFQLLYQDDADDDSDNIIININQDPVLIWQMNPDIDNQFIHSILKYLPAQHNLNDYQVSSVKRNQPQSIFQWIYSVFTHCLSFLH